MSKRKSEHERHETLLPEGQKRRRTSARLSSQKNNDGEDSLRSSQRLETLTASDGDEYSDKQNDMTYSSNTVDMVPCPSCQKHMKAWKVFQHLESCPGPIAESGPSNPTISLQRLQQVRQRKSIERLPALNYSILKDQALRRKLAELGLSNQGPRILLEKRHKEWINLWNANCDAAEPKRRTQLLQDLDIWERTQGYRASPAGPAALNAALIKDKNFDGAAWAARHDSSFKDLIASARNNITKTNTVVKDADTDTDKDKEEDKDEAGQQPNAQQPIQQVLAPPQELPNHDQGANDVRLDLRQESEGVGK
ncbi:hypothetical protein E4U41_000030 [Claviceps citrina]|nr:hypothetical protein E4U41_000030 [Claviceps citrina]